MSKSTIKQALKAPVKEWIICILSVLLPALFMPVFMYARNSDEANLSELMLPLLLFSGIAVAMLFLFLLFTRSMPKAVILSGIMILVLENYKIIETAVKYIFPNLKYWHILPICVVLVLHVGYLLYKIIKNEHALDIAMIFSIVFGSLIFINLGLAIPSIINKVTVSSQENVNPASISADSDIDTNIYLFVLDEGSSFKTLKNYYNYDASEFRSFLETSSFNISENSYCSYPPSTTTILTNFLNLDNVVTNDTPQVEKNARNSNSALSQYLKQKNYTLDGVGDTEWLMIPSLTTEGAGASTINGEDILQLTMTKTFLYPFFSNDSILEKKLILDMFDFYDNPDNFSKNRNSFKFSYVKSPHQPFIFDKDGRDVDLSHYADWGDEKYYLEQYIFIMGKVKESVDKIIKTDPESIIMIMSDHGARFNQNIPAPEKSSILNCLYYKGENVDIEGYSSVNTLITALNRLFGDQLPFVESEEYNFDTTD